MTTSTRHSIAAAFATAALAIGLVAVPIVVAPAAASDASSATATFTKLNQWRTTNSFTALLPNGFLTQYAHDKAKAYARCGAGCVASASTTVAPPAGFQQKFFLFPIAASGTGRPAKLVNKLTSQWEQALSDNALNYGAVGYVTKGTKSYSVFVIAQYTSTPLDRMLPGHATLTGAAAIGATLSAHSGTFAPVPDILFYAWTSNGVSVGTNSPTYVPVVADLHHTISVVITGTKAGFVSVSTKKVTSAQVVLGTIVAPTKPVLAGKRNVGQTLSTNAAGWGTTGTALTVRWLRNDKAIPGAIFGAYVLTPADKGKRIDVELTGTKTGYRTKVRRTSRSTHIGNPLLTATPTPTITGDAEYGDTLTAIPGAWQPSPVSLSYVWKANGHAIAGATHSSYKNTAAVLGKTISVTVTGRKTGWATASVTSAPTIPVSKVNFTTPAVPGVSGTPSVGHTLTAHPGTWVPSATSFTYQWASTTTGTIPGATQSTYTVKAAYSGQVLYVIVTGHRTGFFPASVPGGATTIG